MAKTAKEILNECFLGVIDFNEAAAIDAMKKYAAQKVDGVLIAAGNAQDTLIKEIERLKGLLEQYEERETNPYWYWPQCDVEGCDGVSCRGGGAWEETGYWSVCSEHSQDFREGKPQPKMKQSAIDRENSRDKETGYLPSPKQ